MSYYTLKNMVTLKSRVIHSVILRTICTLVKSTDHSCLLTTYNIGLFHLYTASLRKCNAQYPLFSWVLQLFKVIQGHQNWYQSKAYV